MDGQDGRPGPASRAAGPPGPKGHPGKAGESGADVTGIQGHVGHPGPRGPKGDRGTSVQGATGEPGEAGDCVKPCDQITQVAFMAALSLKYEKFNLRNNTIPFDSILTNVNTGRTNGAYDESGFFTAPLDGVYGFHVHVL